MLDDIKRGILTYRISLKVETLVLSTLPSHPCHLACNAFHPIVIYHNRMHALMLITARKTRMTRKNNSRFMMYLRWHLSELLAPSANPFGGRACALTPAHPELPGGTSVVGVPSLLPSGRGLHGRVPVYQRQVTTHQGPRGRLVYLTCTSRTLSLRHINAAAY